MKDWSKNWKSSTKPKKQRKYRYNAPLHIRKNFLGAHLAKALREKYNKRSINIATGDKVKVMRGQYRGHIGKIEEVNIKKGRVYVAGIEVQKKDGNKTRYPINPSNVLITELNLDDKKRTLILERRKK